MVYSDLSYLAILLLSQLFSQQFPGLFTLAIYIDIMRISTITLSCAILFQNIQAWSPLLPCLKLHNFGLATSRTTGSSPISLQMALDYNDPVVAEEFTKTQTMTLEECEEEITLMGIPVPKTMNEMDVKLMLVELRMRMNGSFSDKSKSEEKIPETFNSKFEEALYTKPSFKELYELFKSNGDHNSMNVAAEYVNDPALGTKRYGSDYKSTLRQIDKALTIVKPITSPIITFSGFPANMGEMGCKMTLEALGEIVDFECTASDDFPVLAGKVTFGDIDTAKAAIKQYNGMDMGMGTKLEVKSV